MINPNKYFSMSNILQEGKSGSISLVKKTIPEGRILRTYNAKQGRYYRDEMVAPMPIIVLSEGDEIWMSDSPTEQEMLQEVIRLAHGNTLICGLGIGLLPTLLRLKNIDVVEKNLDVAFLVWHQLGGIAKYNVIFGDALCYMEHTPNRYDFIYVDIWMGIEQPLQEMEEITAIASKCLAPGGTVRIWCQELYDRVRDRLPKLPIAQTLVPGIHEPCLICEKVLRADYAGLCMDCADQLGVSELFRR